MLKIKHLVSVLMGACLLSPATQAAPTTITVGSSADNVLINNCNGGTPSICTLRAAILRANTLGGSPAEPNEIIIQSGVNPVLTISGAEENSGETGDLDITGYLKITGNSATHNTVESSVDDRVFHILNGARVEISNLDIRNGLVTGETTIAYAGGGIFIDSSSELLLKDSLVRYNSAPVGGGIGNQGRLEIRSNTWESSRIEENTALNLPNNVLITDLLSQQINPGQGGAIANYGGEVYIGSTVIQNNVAGIGGGLYNNNADIGFGNVIITNSQIQTNTSLTHGGGIANIGPLSINNSAVVNNASDASDPSHLGIADPLGDGGGIYNSGTANIEITNVTISGNTARAGGGLFNSRNVSISNTTIYDNTAVPCSSNCTDLNRSQLGGHQIAVYDTDGNYQTADPDISLVNTVIANSSNNTNDPACAGWAELNDPNITSAIAISQFVMPEFVSSLGANLDSDDTCGLGAGDFITDTPGLLELRVNIPEGIDPFSLGRTTTHATDETSALINNGNSAYCPTTDQRFLERMENGKCDIGAYEANTITTQYGFVVDLKIEINGNKDSVSAVSATESGQLKYIVIATNLYEGPPASDTLVTVSVDPTVNILRVSSDQGEQCTIDDNIVTCQVGRLNGLDNVKIEITVDPTVQGTITATATVSSITPEAFTSNDTATETTIVNNTSSSSTNNFGGSGGGGSVSWLWLLILSGLFGRYYKQISRP